MGERIGDSWRFVYQRNVPDSQAALVLSPFSLLSLILAALLRNGVSEGEIGVRMRFPFSIYPVLGLIGSAMKPKSSAVGGLAFARWGASGHIREYVFQGRTVYLFWIGSEANVVDVYDEHCNKIGVLSSDGSQHRINGVDFFSHAVYRRTV